MDESVPSVTCKISLYDCIVCPSHAKEKKNKKLRHRSFTPIHPAYFVLTINFSFRRRKRSGTSPSVRSLLRDVTHAAVKWMTFLLVTACPVMVLFMSRMLRGYVPLFSSTPCLYGRFYDCN